MTEPKETGAVTELLRLYERLQELAALWLHQLPVGGDGSGPTPLLTAYWDVYEQTLGQVLASPTFGLTRGFSERLLAGYEAWLDLLRAGSQYQWLLAGAWWRVPERFVRELAFADRQSPIGSLQELVHAWLEVGDRVFIELFHSDEYLEAQGDFLQKTMVYRLREREIVEDLLRVSHLPTRSEVDDVHRNLYELRKELKALKKALPEGREVTPQAPKRPRRGGPRMAEGEH